MSDAVLIPLIVLGFLVVFPLFWSAIVWVAGFKWRSIAEEYPASEWPRGGYNVSWQSGRIGVTSYSGALNFAATEDGLYARPVVFFRPGHPPIFVPWSEIESVEGAVLGGRRIRTRAGHEIVVSKNLGEAVDRAADAYDESIRQSTEPERVDIENGGSPEGAAARVRARSR